MKIKFVLFISFIFIINSFSQDEKAKTFFDSPFGGGGGFTPVWIIPNFNPLNDKLINFGTGTLNKNGFFATGGSGFAYIGFVPNLRIGGFGFGGSTKQNSVSNGMQHEVIYSSSFGGATFEYTFSSFRDIGISIGFMIGSGKTEIQLYRNKGIFDWNSTWNELVNNIYTEEFSRTISSSYFIFSPTLNVDIPFYRFIAFRIGAGYCFAFGENWKIENNKDLNGTPSDLKGNAFFIQTGIYFGFFSF